MKRLSPEVRQVEPSPRGWRKYVSFRLLHTADLHLDAPLAGVGPLSPEMTSRVARAGLDTLDRVVDLAIAERVDAMVVAGGLVVGAPPSQRSAERLVAALRRLADHGIAAIVGRHQGEPLEALLDGWTPPALVSLLPPADVRAVEIEREGEKVCTLLSAAGVDGLAALARQPADPQGRPLVAVCPLPPQRPGVAAPPPLQGSPVGYWALGGRWPAQAARLAPSGAWVVMAGTPQLHRFPEPGVGAGAVLVENVFGEFTTPVWRPVAAVQLLTLSVALRLADTPAPPPPIISFTDLDALIHYLHGVGRALVVQYPDDAVLIRVLVDAEGPARRSLGDPAHQGAVLDALRASADESCWWCELSLATPPLSKLGDGAPGVVEAARAAMQRGANDVMGEARLGVAVQPSTPPRPLPPAAMWSPLVLEAAGLAAAALTSSTTGGEADTT